MMTHRNDSFSRLCGGLNLAAAPIFAAMTLLSAMPGEGPTLCARHFWPLNGMTVMYALMSVVHLGPWLMLMSGRRSTESRQTCHSRVSLARE